MRIVDRYRDVIIARNRVQVSLRQREIEVELVVVIVVVTESKRELGAVGVNLIAAVWAIAVRGGG